MGASPADLYISEFNNNVQLLSMQSRSRLRQWVMTGSHVGKQASPVDQIAATAMSTQAARNQPKINTAIANERRWVQPTSFFTHTICDNFDKVRTRVQLNSPYLKSQMNAMNKEMDIKVIDSALATSVVGEEGGSTVTFANDGGTSIAVGTTDLTSVKLLDGLKSLKEGEVDLDDPEEAIICVITPHQEATLLNDEKFINADYISKQLLAERGNLTWWKGINFIISNQLTGKVDGVRADVDPGANEDRSVLMWAKSGMHLGLWDDIHGKIVERTDLTNDPPEMSVYATIGATRLEGAKVVEIVCDET